MRVHAREPRDHNFLLLFSEYTQIRVIKILCLSRSVMFHAHVKGVSERSELTSCI